MTGRPMRGRAAGTTRGALSVLLLALAATGGAPAAETSEAPRAEETPAAPAQAGAVRIEAAADRKTITIGDPITVTIRLTHPRDVRVTRFEPEGALGSDTVLLGRQAGQTTLPDGAVQETRVLRVTRYSLGGARIPSFDATFVDAAGKEAKVATAPLSFTVGSVLAEGDTRPADIKNPAVMPETPLWPWVLLAAAAAAAAAWLWWRRRRRRPAIEAVVPVVPPRPAHEVAYSELERLLSSGLLEKGRIKEFYIELAEIVKRYFEARFGVDTFERTSAEILETLRLARLPARAMALTSELFGSCDLVKFAKHVPSSDDTRTVVEKAYGLVDETRMRDEPRSREDRIAEKGAAAGGVS